MEDLLESLREEFEDRIEDYEEIISRITRCKSVIGEANVHGSTFLAAPSSHVSIYVRT